MWPCMKLKHLQASIQDLDGFTKPKVLLEQYPTPPHLASHMMYAVQSQYGDIEGKLVADLGCGCGSLSLCAAVLDAGFVVGFEIDPEALEVFESNKESMELANLDSVLWDVNHGVPSRLYNYFDTVIMNPPFGTKRNAGIDMKFLQTAFQMTSNSVYSLHKTTTRAHVLKFAQDFDFEASVMAELHFDLPQTYKFHKKAFVDVYVDLYRFVKKIDV